MLIFNHSNIVHIPNCENSPFSAFENIYIGTFCQQTYNMLFYTFILKNNRFTKNCMTNNNTKSHGQPLINPIVSITRGCVVWARYALPRGMSNEGTMLITDHDAPTQILGYFYPRLLTLQCMATGVKIKMRNGAKHSFSTEADPGGTTTLHMHKCVQGKNFQRRSKFSRWFFFLLVPRKMKNIESDSV